jgi:two-component system chemotaxis sensor kinase CheA
VANRKDDIKSRLMATFRVEAEEHLQILTASLLALERGGPPGEVRALLETAFREMHTLKGAARSVGLADVESLCQASESLLSRLTRGQIEPSRRILGRLQEAVDAVGRLLGGADRADVAEVIGRIEKAVEPAAAAEGPAPSPAPAAPLPSALAPAATQVATVRVPLAKLDAIAFQAEELLVLKLAAQERAREAGALAEVWEASRASLERLRQALKADGGAAARTAEGLAAAQKAAGARTRDLSARLLRDQRTIAGAVEGLLEETRRLRMTPASSILDLFPRMVRDLAEEQGKDIELVAQGGALELDRRVLEAAKDPLIHLVRNAVDHGIEPPKARAEAGKPPRGRVSVSVASLEGGRVEIRVEDDGRGIDPARVKEAAVRAGLLTSEAAEALADDGALELVYRSGLSTSPIVTGVSGHGLGLAIVKERVERLGGRIDIETRAGKGTSVRMALPATIATFHGLRVRSAGQAFLLPLGAVERAVRVGLEDIKTVEGRPAVAGNGHPLFLARLGELLGLPDTAGTPQPHGKAPCVVARVGDQRLGLLVDEVVGDCEVLVKELQPPLVRVRNVAEAGLLGTGEIVLILRPSDLLRSAGGARRAPAPGPVAEARRPLAILVVDDSITTRTMEKNLLEAAGYRVRVAVDGIDAWTALKSEEFDLVVSDVDMPRLDGFDLTARIRADPKLKDLPVVLVTALESREDKERGIEVGANAYVVKSSFDQSNLLQIIGRLA